MDAVGRYVLLEKIGTGGMAEVWKARVDGPAGFVKMVAVKRMLAELSARAEYVDLFTREALLAAGLHHPNIVQVFDFGHAGTHEGEDFGYFMAMEFVDGENLSSLLFTLRSKGETLPQDVALYVALSVARGLAHAHGSGQSTGHEAMVHQDISPHNVLLSRTGEVKITDFGIARLAAEIPANRRLMGKLGYMSPEQVRGKLVDHRTDLFALGIVLVEMLTNKRLFPSTKDSDKLEVFAAIRSFRPEEHPLVQSCPEALRPILHKLLATTPERRYESALQAERELGRQLGMEGSIAARQTLAHLMTLYFQREDDPLESSDESTLTRIVRQDEPTAAPAVRFDTAPETRATVATHSTTLEPPAPRRARWVALAVVGVVAIASVIALPRLFGPVLARVTPTPTPLPTSEPSPLPTTVVVERTATIASTSTPAPVLHKGSLTVNARPWVEVWVDGSRVIAETPLRDFALAAGPHELRFENPSRKFSITQHVDVEPGAEVKLFVDVDAGTVEPR